MKGWSLSLFILLFCFFIFQIGCGGSNVTESGEAETAGDSGSDSGDDEEFTMDTEKLVGTPFEGLTAGDSLERTLFICGQYRTESIDSFPIRVFAAFFYDYEEEIIQEAIDFTNEALGFEAYEMTDEWSNDVRVIYQMEDLDANGDNTGIVMGFNGTQYAEVQIPDWAVRINEGRSLLPMYVVAHELGHANGIQNHALIDYENDTFTELEEDSLMEGDGGDTDSPALTDYYYMMERQGQIMQDHVGEVGEVVGGLDCENE